MSFSPTEPKNICEEPVSKSMPPHNLISETRPLFAQRNHVQVREAGPWDLYGFEKGERDGAHGGNREKEEEEEAVGNSRKMTGDRKSKEGDLVVLEAHAT